MCTEECFKKKIKEVKFEKVNPFLPKIERPLLTKEQMRIKKSNEKWLERTEPLNSKPQHMNNARLERARAWYGGDLISKRFNHVRG